jgi:hypothetical protein
MPRANGRNTCSAGRLKVRFSDDGTAFVLATLEQILRDSPSG